MQLCYHLGNLSEHRVIWKHLLVFFKIRRITIAFKFGNRISQKFDKTRAYFSEFHDVLHIFY